MIRTEKNVSSEPNEASQKLVLTPQEAADALGINRSTLYLLIMSGELPSFKIGRCRRIPIKALEAWIARQSAA